MRKFLLALSLIVILGACSGGGGGDGDDDAAVVTEGMSPAEVEQILGEPTATVNLVDAATGTTVIGFKATYPGEGGSWVSYEDDKVTDYIIGGYIGSP